MLRRRFIKILFYLFSGIALLLLVLAIYLALVATVNPPDPSDKGSVSWSRKTVGDNLYKIKNSWFRKSNSGLYELYVEGDSFERGVVIGKLTKELVQKQEEVFIGQIHQLVPSNTYLQFLKYFVGWFNRDLEANVPKEYKLEILGVSGAASHDYDNITSPYQRLLNYHAAHDIGHALQNMSLVGCTSFGVWGGRAKDSTLTIGRNFDFFVGDKFAEDKIIAFYNPKHGYRFMMITWGGMTGVLSGMNYEGLTVTINAAKSEVPSASATPVSIVAREILQYASTIDEAYNIASKRKMFVSESFLIGSAKDNRAVLIEKTKDDIALFDSQKEEIISTNHFQSTTLGKTELNMEHIKTSASPYRYERVKELMGRRTSLSVSDIAEVLRDRNGLNNKNIGLGNEKSINQLVAHHSIIFQPEKKLVWVSTEPWQLGKYVCYDLDKVFKEKMESSHEIVDSSRTINPDPFLLTKECNEYLKFARYRFPFEPRDNMNPDSVVKWNPDSYHSYMLAGDFCFSDKQYAKAEQFYNIGLTKEIATVQERNHMERNIIRCKEKLK